MLNNESCAICCENYIDLNKKIGDKRCSFCLVSFCSVCIRRYLTEYSKLNPSCPSCSHEWTMEFIYNITPSSFYNIYRDYRTSIVIEREISLLPATQQKIDDENERLLMITILRSKMISELSAIKNIETLILDISKNIFVLHTQLKEHFRLFKGSIPNADGVVIEDNTLNMSMPMFLKKLSNINIIYDEKILEYENIKVAYTNKYQNEVSSLSKKER